MGQQVELRSIKAGGKFRLVGAAAEYVRGEYDRSSRSYYAKEIGYSDVYKFPAAAVVEVAA